MNLTDEFMKECFDKMFPPVEGEMTEQEGLDRAHEKWGDAIDAVKAIEEPHFLCILDEGNLAFYENLSDRGDFETMKQMLAMLAYCCVDMIGEAEGCEAACAFLSKLTVTCLA